MTTHIGITALIAQLGAEFRVTGRSPEAVEALGRVARHDPALCSLVEQHVVSSPLDLVVALRTARGRRERDEAARLVSVLLRHAADEPHLKRTLIEAMLPGLFRIGRTLNWGVSEGWAMSDFYCDLVSTLAMVVDEWAGKDRKYAANDLLNATRLRMRREVMGASATQDRQRDLMARLRPVAA